MSQEMRAHVWLVWLWACGGPPEPAAPAQETQAPVPGVAPAPPPEMAPEPRVSSRPEAGVDELSAALAQHEAELDELLGGALSGDGCGRACTALESMESAANGICRIAGASDERCQRARSALDRSRGRVSAAGCTCT